MYIGSRVSSNNFILSQMLITDCFPSRAVFAFSESFPFFPGGSWLEAVTIASQSWGACFFGRPGPFYWILVMTSNLWYVEVLSSHLTALFSLHICVWEVAMAPRLPLMNWCVLTVVMRLLSIHLIDWCVSVVGMMLMLLLVDCCKHFHLVHHHHQSYSDAWYPVHSMML